MGMVCRRFSLGHPTRRSSPNTFMSFLHHVGSGESENPDVKQGNHGQNLSELVGSKKASRALGTMQMSKKNDTREPPLGLKIKIERLWRSFFADPSHWWDNTSEKVNPKFPDFNHKHTKQGLWLEDKLNPPWVASKLAAMAPGTVQMHSFSWTQKLSRCNKSKNYQTTMQLFEQMQVQGLSLDRFVFVPVLNACAGLQSLEEGKRIHTQVIVAGCELDPYVSSCLVDMYAKCGRMEDARAVFNKIPTRTVAAWNSMILGHVNSGQGRQALELFHHMLSEDVQPNSYTFVGLLNACASLESLEEGRNIHGHIKESGCEYHTYVSSSLVDMYAKCGSIDEAYSVFSKMPTRDVVAWSAIILGHVNCGQGQKALEIFQQMQNEGVEPDSFTFVGVLNACASILALEEGRHVHGQIIRSGCKLNAYILSSLVDMYAKCGSMNDAWRVFDKMATHNVVVWNAMILGHMRTGQGMKALELFEQMQREGAEPDAITFVGVLNACASVAGVEAGRLVHGQIRQSGHESDVHVGSSLVDMYAKCGSIADARRVFNKMPTRSVVAWTAMIGGHARHGNAHDAIALFEEMCAEGLELDEVTFVCLLSACSHGGLVKEGVHYFESMKPVYGVSPNTEHYACMVDLLGRVGRLDDAMEMVKTMPLKPNVRVWMSLLSACRIHGSVEMGKFAAEQVLELDSKNSAGHVLLSNMYAASSPLEQ